MERTANRQQYKLCILFLYHQCDEVTRRHFEVLTLSNPKAVIVPLTDSVSEHLPDTVDVGPYDGHWQVSNPWRNIDVSVYKWFERRTFDAEKYVFLEYDCFCNVDLIEYYREVWESDVAGVDFFTKENNPKWNWFAEEPLSTLRADDRPYASAVVPFVGCLWSHTALEQVVAHVSREDIFSELRLGTAIRMLGLKFKRLPLSKRATICWHSYPWQVNRPGLFHGIKSCRHNEGKRVQPGRFGEWIYDLRRSWSSKRMFRKIGLGRILQSFP